MRNDELLRYLREPPKRSEKWGWGREEEEETVRKTSVGACENVNVNGNKMQNDSIGYAVPWPYFSLLPDAYLLFFSCIFCLNF